MSSEAHSLADAAHENAAHHFAEARRLSALIDLLLEALALAEAGFSTLANDKTVLDRSPDFARFNAVLARNTLERVNRERKQHES